MERSSEYSSLRLYLGDVKRYPLLRREEEIELAKRIENGDADARERLINSNLRLVVYIAWDYSKKGSLMDVIQDGNIGLMKAVEKYDYREGFKFITYAYWWINQSIQRGLSNDGTIRIPVHSRERLLRIYWLLERLPLEDNGGGKTRSEILADMYNRGHKKAVSPKKVEDDLRIIFSVLNPVSLDERMATEDNNTVPFGELLSDPTQNPVEDAVIDERRRRIEWLLSKLEPREKFILESRFGLLDGDEYLLREIGETLHLTRERVRQLLEEILERLRHYASSHPAADDLRDF